MNEINKTVTDSMELNPSSVAIIRSFSNSFKILLHYCLSRARRIQSIALHPIYPRPTLILSFQLVKVFIVVSFL
jgi:hypothetical protein